MHQSIAPSDLSRALKVARISCSLEQLRDLVEALNAGLKMRDRLVMEKPA